MAATKNQRKNKPQINVQATASLKSAYEGASTVLGLNNGRLVLAGMLWLFQHPQFRQVALDELEQFETEPKTPKQIRAWLRSTVDKDFGEVVEAEVEADRRRRPKKPDRRPPEADTG